ncbi:MAG: hypothetical protein EB084_09150 [Proteobacteria bacterium]|nr:hypothetical protein [Pseudomonadota bacterium]
MTSGERSVIMEDHGDAYPAWRGGNVAGITCVHLDAHLDLSDEGLTPAHIEAMRQARTPESLRGLRADPHLPWGGYHGGNYLYPALLDGTVSSLVWVIPPWLPGQADLLTFTRVELQKWYQVTLADHASFHLIDGTVRGTVLGRPFTLCTIENLPRIEEPMLLDIDADYFLDHDDGLFTDVEVITETLSGLLDRAAMITVAYSVEGGYMPLEHRYVGDLVLRLLSGHDPSSALAARHLRRGDTARAERRFSDALAAYEAAAREPWLAAAARLKQSLVSSDLGRSDDARRLAAEAAAIDGRYAPRALDVAFLFLRRGDPARAVSHLSRAREENPLDASLTLYMEGVAHLLAQHFDDAALAFQRLLLSDALPPAECAQMSMMLSRALLRAGQAVEAVSAARRAVDTGPGIGAHHLQLAHALRATNRSEEAARHYRKAISLTDHAIASIEAHRALIALYQASGQTLLAQGEMRRLARKAGDADVERRARGEGSET